MPDIQIITSFDFETTTNWIAALQAHREQLRAATVNELIAKAEAFGLTVVDGNGKKRRPRRAQITS